MPPPIISRLHSLSNPHVSKFFLCSLIVGLSALTWQDSASQQAPTNGLPRNFPPPKSPQETLASIVVPPGLRVEVVAAEPDVVDPVAFTWDAQGRLYVVEMNDYPTGPTGGRIKLLQGIRGNARIERVSIFADGLPYPDGIFPWRRGVLVSAAPNIWYLEDTDGDGRADIRKIILTGFHEGNPQHRVNGLIWGLDNWIYGCNGDSGGTIYAPDHPHHPKLEIRGRDFRFRPDTGQVEPVSGQSQFGHTFDAWGRRFFCNNRIHIRFAPIPDHYLRRAPQLAVPNILNIADYGAIGASIFPLTPPSERFNDYTHTGHFTSACGIHIYLGDLLPADYQGCAYVCDPVHNLVHRCRLVPQGAIFVAQRVDQKSEFFASRDPWCRPVFLGTGPDGALYIADFYRAVVEHPQWIPADVQKRLDLRAGHDRGRIYRIVPEHSSAAQYPNLEQASSAALVRELSHTNVWRRDTAQRLLVERQDKSIVPALEHLASNHPDAQARLRALWTLEGLHALSDELIARALSHPEPGLRENALILAEKRLNKSPYLQERMLTLAPDKNPRVRFQLALTLSMLPAEKSYPVLAQLAQHDAQDPWIRQAIVIATAENPLAFLQTLAAKTSLLDKPQPGQLIMITQLARLIGQRRHDAETVTFLELAISPKWRFQDQLAVITAVLEGRARAQPLSFLKGLSPTMRTQLERLSRQATHILQREDSDLNELISALRYLTIISPNEARQLAEKYLHARYPPDLQLVALQAYSDHLDEGHANRLIARLAELSPGVRAEALERLLRNKEAAPWLLNALENGIIQPGDLDSRRRQQLLDALPQELRVRAEKTLGRLSPRQEVFRAYRDALQLKPNPNRGSELFAQHCAQCHQRNGQGIAVGPNLDDARGRTPEQLLEDILHPNAAVAPNYMTYIAETKNGQIFTGILISENEHYIVLLRAQGVREEIRRHDLVEIRALPVSLMPENWEQSLSKQDLADLIAWLRQP
ncbi:MAG: c-type cytochrome [Gemmatales bacterium]|nr:c-type cytochrome [Gemmatales bacterium]MDW7993515.1 c-type cytochrome [Gemmatales bacterium]